MARTVYTGCYGNEDEGHGVGVWRFDDATGALTHVRTAPVNSPSFVTVHPDGRHLYAVCERDGFAGTPDGAVASFAVDPHDGTLTEIGKGVSAPRISTSAGWIPTSSCASRRAVCTGDSPGSMRPPGSETCPRC